MERKNRNTLHYGFCGVWALRSALSELAISKHGGESGYLSSSPNTVDREYIDPQPIQEKVLMSICLKSK